MSAPEVRGRLTVLQTDHFDRVICDSNCWYRLVTFPQAWLAEQLGCEPVPGLVFSAAGRWGSSEWVYVEPHDFRVEATSQNPERTTTGG